MDRNFVRLKKKDKEGVETIIDFEEFGNFVRYTYMELGTFGAYVKFFTKEVAKIKLTEKLKEGYEYE
ncbi:MAG: hypothetical protein ACRC0V_08420 [Fusobacteriaceae bacterium]